MYQPYNNPYGAPYYDSQMYLQFQQTLMKKQEDKRNIRKLATYTGCAVLLYLLAQNLLSLLIPVFGLTELYLNNSYFQSGLNTILVVGTILPAFAFMGRKMKKVSGIERPVDFSRPKSFGNTLLAFFAGMGICMIANYATGIVSVFFTMFGYESTSPDITMPEGLFGMVLSVAQIVLTAATVEELSLRGYVMGNLRKYGDLFAVIASSIVFGLIHGNLVQIPFALVAGLGIGYLTVKTDSLWTGVLVHAGNNLFSVAIMYLGMYLSEEIYTAIYYFLFFFFAVFGMICFAVFQKKNKSRPLVKSLSPLSTKEKLGAFISSPAIIVVTVIMLLTSLVYLIPMGE